MNKVEEKLKAGRVKRPEGTGVIEEHQKKHSGTPNYPIKTDLTSTNSSSDLLIVEALF